MNTLTQKLNIAKLHFQADKKRVAAVALLFSVVIGSAWATMVPNTLAGFYYDHGASNAYYGYNDIPTGNYNYNGYDDSYYSYGYDNPYSSNYNDPYYGGYYNSNSNYNPSTYANSYNANSNYNTNVFSGSYYGNYNNGYYYPTNTAAPTATTQTNVYGTDPRFNIFTPFTHTQADNHDYYLFDIKNETKNTSYGDPANADAGDILIFSIYYHNGVLETTAHNTKIKVSIPTNIGTQIVSTASLWADNAVNATSGNPMTETGTVNISSSQKLEYITDSAKWYPDRKNPNTDAPTPFLNGQSGDEIVSQGVNLGDIKGCWEFSGFVNLKIRVSGITYNPDLTIEKTVRNVASGQYDYSESIIAKPKQRVSFQLKVRSTGTAAAKNIIVRDVLPDRLSFVSGSTHIDGYPTGDGITTNSGINIGEIPVGGIKTITFTADIGNESQFSKGNTTLTNTAYTRADNVSEKSDPATIIVRNEGCDPNIIAPAWR